MTSNARNCREVVAGSQNQTTPPVVGEGLQSIAIAAWAAPPATSCAVPAHCRHFVRTAWPSIAATSLAISSSREAAGGGGSNMTVCPRQRRIDPLQQQVPLDGPARVGIGGRSDSSVGGTRMPRIVQIHVLAPVRRLLATSGAIPQAPPQPARAIAPTRPGRVASRSSSLDIVERRMGQRLTGCTCPGPPMSAILTPRRSASRLTTARAR